MFKRVVIIVMDSVGIGSAPDAEIFGDQGADTLGHIEALHSIDCPTLKSLGLSRIARIAPSEEPVRGIFGRMLEASTGKDTTSGHWEFMGHPVKEPFPVFYDAFPKTLMDRFVEVTGYEYLGNEVASGTEIIERLGEEHIRTGKPIIYTSADSVFQIAAHEEIIPVKELYRICELVRKEVCVGDANVGRIIARPFVGTKGHFKRTANRHDYSRMPNKKLYTEMLVEAGISVVGVGKIGDIFANVGISVSYPTTSNEHGMAKVTQLLASDFTHGLLLVNLVDFDSLYGHRRDPHGYKRAIENFDAQLKGLLAVLEEDTLLLITADHGNDPTWHGTDHTREIVPLLGYYQDCKGEIYLGDRDTFSDIGQTILENFTLPLGEYGSSFLKEISSVREGK